MADDKVQQGKADDKVQQANMLSSPDKIQQRFVDMYQNYTRSLQLAWAPEEVRKRLHAAHREYVAALRETFLAMDVAAVDANTLLAMSQSLAAAAWMAAACGAGAR